MALGMNQANKISVNIETAEDFNVQELIKAKVEKALQEVVNQCSKDYFRNIKASITLNLE